VDTLNKIESKISKEYPNVKVKSYSPPYKALFSEEDSQIMCNVVNDFIPDVLFVGMTAPKQEKWVDANKHRLKVKNIASIGAVFDFYAGNVKRSSPFWISFGVGMVASVFKRTKATSAAKPHFKHLHLLRMYLNRRCLSRCFNKTL
jgi:N-acetylglucosaminyldiphosphoundecaprenol N-acetyl-beta-D-mannosaminyltransferase